MRIQNKDSRITFDMSNSPQFIILDGIMGYITLIDKEVYFFYAKGADVDYKVVTSKFTILPVEKAKSDTVYTRNEVLVMLRKLNNYHIGAENHHVDVQEEAYLEQYLYKDREK